MIELKSTFALCDIWRHRNPKIRTFTFLLFGKITGLALFIRRISRLDFFCFKCFAKVKFAKQMS